MTNYVNFEGIDNNAKYRFREKMIIENRLGRIAEVHLLQHIYQTDKTELTICDNYMRELLALELGSNAHQMEEKHVRDAWYSFRKYLRMNPHMYDVKHYPDRVEITIKRASSQLKYREGKRAQV